MSDVSIEVPPGTIVGLIGPNGAGKTSFVDALTGFAPCEGSVRLDGRSIERLRPHQRRAAGLSRTWQAGELFATLTVAENVLVSAHPPRFSTLWSDVFGRRGDRLEIVREILDLVGLVGKESVPVGSLTLGQQKLVGVARALAGGCSTLLLDEPAAGLDSSESLEFAQRSRAIVETGPGALLIDHDVDLMLRVCDVVHVLEFGKQIFSGSPAETRSDPKVVAAYLGSPVEA
ncbi:ABC transporter ATP-binding protein [Nocardioides sp. LML1-1-1.1]|uniref:ABC transporter ATP-binding protein n=1 Tax=Nocardioides sp. LML1-1-1.1 TaxID=3135248 RepID=UPI003443DEEE